MADFTDRHSFANWLAARPDETCRIEAAALASRAAARSLPLLARSKLRGQPFSNMCLTSFRANALIWAAVRYPAHLAELREAASNANAAAFATANDLSMAVDAPPVIAAGYAAAAVSSSAGHVHAYAASAVDIASMAYLNVHADLVTSAFAKVQADATALEASGTVASLANSSLAAVGAASVDAISLEYWRKLSKRLLARKAEHWKVWTGWYEAVSSGNTWLREFDEEARKKLIFAICQLPNEDWENPKIANKRISDLIESAAKDAQNRRGDPRRAEVPSVTAAALNPIWRGGQLTLSNQPVAADLSPEAFIAAFRALHDECVDLIVALRREVAVQQAQHGSTNIDQRPADYLERLVNMIGADIPAQHELFRIGHVAQALSASIGLVNDSWPDFHALRFRLLVSQFGEIAKRVPAWREFWAESLESHPSQVEVAAAPQLARDLADLLDQDRGAEERPLIAPVLPQAVRDLAEEAGRLQKLADEAREINEVQRQALEALAVDIYESANNILKSMAEAVVAGLAAVNRTDTAQGLKKGYSEEYPKQIHKLGRQLARVAVWAPVGMAVGGCAYLADKYAWLQPVLQLLKKHLGG